MKSYRQEVTTLSDSYGDGHHASSAPDSVYDNQEEIGCDVTVAMSHLLFNGELSTSIE